jgi:hypothetical protein
VQPPPPTNTKRSKVFTFLDELEAFENLLGRKKKFPKKSYG